MADSEDDDDAPVVAAPAPAAPKDTGPNDWITPPARAGAPVTVAAQDRGADDWVLADGKPDDWTAPKPDPSAVLQATRSLVPRQLARGLIDTGATMLKGAAVISPDQPLETVQPGAYDESGYLPNPDFTPPPRTSSPKDSALYHAGAAVDEFGKKYIPTSQEEDESVTGQVSRTIGGVAPMIAGALLAPGVAIPAGAAAFGLSSAGSTFDRAKEKGASDDDAVKAAGLSGYVGAAMGVLPLGAVLSPIKRLAPGLTGWVVSKLAQAGQSGVAFATIGEAQHYLNEEIAKAYYDGNAKYSPDVKRMFASALAGAMLGTLHPLGPQAPGKELGKPETAFGDRPSAADWKPTDEWQEVPTDNGAGNAVRRATRDTPLEFKIEDGKIYARKKGATETPADDWVAPEADEAPTPEQPTAAPAPRTPPAPTTAAEASDAVTTLRSYGYSDTQILAMPPEQFAREVAAIKAEDARQAQEDVAAGAPQEQGTAPDQTGANPVSNRGEQQTAPQPHGAAALGDMLDDPRSADEIRADMQRAKNDAAAAPPPRTELNGISRDVLDNPGRGLNSLIYERISKGVPEGMSLAEHDANAKPEGSREAPVSIETPDDVHTGAERTADPTPAQAEAGNYRKRHIEWQGLEGAIETEAGQLRTGIGADGKPWSTTLQHPYGYFKGTLGKDGDELDFYLGPHPDSPNAYVVDQIDPDNLKFDEHKIVIGARSPEEADAIYQSGFSDGTGAMRGASITQMSPAELKTWIEKGDTKRPLAYQPPQNARAAPQRGPLSLFQFLAKNGGIKEHGGELQAMDLHKAFVPGFGRLVRQNGKPLDQAREAAVEAGYLHDEGSHSGGESTSTVKDLLDALSEEAHGRKLYSQHDIEEVANRMEAGQAKDEKAQLARAKVDIAEIAKTKGFNATDQQIEEAARHHLVNHADPIDALVDILERDAIADEHDLTQTSQPHGAADVQVEPTGADASGAKPAPPVQSAEPTGQAPAGSPPARVEPGSDQQGGSREASGPLEIGEPNWKPTKTGGYSVDDAELPKFKDIGDGYAIRAYRESPLSGGHVRQEIRTPEGNVLIRGTQSDGKPYEEYESSTNPRARGGMAWVDKALAKLKERMERPRIEAPAEPTKTAGEPVTRAVKPTVNSDNQKAENVNSEAAKLNSASTPDVTLAHALLELLKADRPITAKILQAEATKAHGGKLSEGKFDRKDAQDALEVAVNMLIKEDALFRVDDGKWERALSLLEGMQRGLPTQRVRSEEQTAFDQFSTPPAYAAAAVYAVKLRAGDVILEPSAGTGSLVAAASMPGVKIIANELSPRRTALLRELIGNYAQVFTENAEQIHNILPANVKPTVVVMNPPFSATAGRMGEKKVAMTAAVHIEEALNRLEPGGRLVAIVGRGMTMGSPTFRKWWDKIGERNSIRANIGVDGSVFEKYGTTFGTRVVVIDKVQPSAGAKPVLADAQTVDDLMRALEPIRESRPQTDHADAEQHAAQSSGTDVAEGAGGQALPQHPATGVAGVGGRGAGRVAGEGSPRVAGTSEPAVRVEAGNRADVAAQQSERPAVGGADGELAQRPANGAQPAPGGSVGAKRDLQPAAKSEPGAATGGERIELEQHDPGTQAATDGISESLYQNYEPQRVRVKGAKPHPGPLVESASMSSVEPPAPNYSPSLPRKVIDKGLLSIAQLEPVIYAGRAHAAMLPAGDGEVAKRRGFFIGDGTGVGKGREIAGIILDNWSQGRTKAIWVSEKQKLLNDAKRDWSGLELNPNMLFNAGKVKTGEPIQAEKGIGFITYDTLKGGMSDQAAIARGGFVRKQPVSVNGQSGIVSRVTPGNNKREAQITVKLANGTDVTVPAGEVTAGDAMVVKSRVDQLVDWFGKDFDGVIAFDESHNMGNASSTKGERGDKDAAQKALAGLELQKRLPNARVVYVSATGATEVSNLAYADRLGLWGRGTPFASQEKFVTEVEKGGIAAMELIARDMKQLGLYTARNLSYDGVEYARLEHKLDDNQREIYDTLAEAWQNVLRNINEALEETGGNKDGKAKSAVMSAFWGGHQRFFNQIITSMQMPSVIKAVEADIAAGRQAVLQLTNTNEASQERAAAKATTAEEIEDLDITPRDQIIQLVEKSFPTQEYEVYVDENGKERSRPVVDSNGNPVQNKQAVAIREALVDKLASIRVPQGPLDMVLDHFGAENVSEVTGRGRRFVLKPDEKTGERRRVEENRPGSSNQSEIDSFQGGKKKILVFSEAGGTGASYHADNTSASKDSRRAHYLVQGGWRADKAVQGFGRTHRTNQASAPIVRLVTTDLQGQKRFISSIARRLAQLGALTKGQRQAGDQGIFSARDNLESTEAKHALQQFYNDILHDAIPGVTINDFEAQTGLKLRIQDDEGRVTGAKENLPPITTFLNRLLSLKIDMQNRVFDAFSERLDRVIEAREAAGLLDVGLETVKADKITKDTERTVHTVEESKAETKHVKFTVSDKFESIPFKEIADNTKRPVEFYVSSPKGRVYAVAKAAALTDEKGKIVDYYRLINPVSGSHVIERQKVDNGKDWSKVDRGRAQEMWGHETDKAPEYLTRELHLITGAILPIWDRLGGSTRVVRLQTDSGERYIGRVVPKSALAQTLKKLGAEGEQQSYTPDKLYTALMAGGRAALTNGWTLARRMVAGEQRIELTGPSNFSEGNEVKADGVFTERIDYKLRYFVPTDEATGADVLGKLTKYRQVVDMTEGGAKNPDLAAGGDDGPMFAMRRGEEGFGDLPSLVKAAPSGWAEHGEANAAVAPYINTPFTDAFAEHAAAIGPLLRAELDRLGLKDIALRLADRIETLFGNGGVGAADGLYYKKTIMVSLSSERKFNVLHHEALHGLRRMDVFSDAEWNLLVKQSQAKWREQFKIDDGYRHTSEDTKNEEGIAHAYAEWAAGKSKVDGRFVRLFKRIRDFLEALGNALRGAGFKTAEDIFRDIKSGEIGRRAGSTERPAEPMAAAKRDFPTETGADGKPQTVIPGAERISDRKIAERRSEKPLEPKKPQKGTEGLPLFGEPDTQLPMFAMKRSPAADKADMSVRDRIAAVFDSKAARKLTEGAQDLSHPVKLLQQELDMRRDMPPEGSNSGEPLESQLSDEADFYTKKRLFPGRVAVEVQDFNKAHLDPLIETMRTGGISLEQAGDYAMAKHTEERNGLLGEMYPPEHAFNQAMLDTSITGASGRSTDWARDVLNKAKADGTAHVLEKVSKQLAAIKEYSLEKMQSYGLETPARIKSWREQYEHYVPLSGWEDRPEEAPPEYHEGRKFNVRGKEVKQAFGRASKADNPVVSLIDQAYRTLDRGERNVYLQSLAINLGSFDPKDIGDIVQFNHGAPKKIIDRQTGMVRVVDDTSFRFKPEAVAYKVGGNVRYMVFKERAIAEAIKRMSPDEVGMLQPLLNVQNKIKALWTHYSPDFLVRHFLFRYPIEGTLNAFEQKGQGDRTAKMSEYVKDAIPFLGNATKAIFARQKGKDAGEMGKYWDEMRKMGGAMTFRSMRDTDLLREHLGIQLKSLSKRPLATMAQKWRAGVEAMDYVTNTLDNSLRLAAYAQARKSGKTPQQAAFIAREATVDFQLKGRFSNAIGLWFPFGNVAIQTGARMTKAVVRSRIMRRVFMGTMLAGALIAMFNYLVGGDDKDGVPFFEKIPEWDRRLNIIILNPFDKDDKGRPQPIKIPMPYNWAFPMVLGYAMANRVFGKESLGKTAAMVATSGLEVLTPFGQEHNKIAMMTPELARPFVHVMTNKDWAGRPIHANESFQKRPNAESPRRTTGEGWQAMSSYINRLSGGSRTKSGVLDFYPEDYREIFNYVGGTQSRLAQNIYQTGKSIGEGEAPDSTKIPLARVVHGTDYDAADRAAKFERLDKMKKPWKH